MPLKMNAEPPKKVDGKPQPADYSQHLGHNVKPVVGIVTTEKKLKNEEAHGGVSQSQTLNPGVFVNKQFGMSITVEGSRTLNLGNYESARIGVNITVPCEPTTLNDAYEYATNWVSEKITEAEKSIKG